MKCQQLPNNIVIDKTGLCRFCAFNCQNTLFSWVENVRKYELETIFLLQIPKVNFFKN